MQSYRCHQAIQTLGEFFGFVKETIRVAGIEQHRAKLWMLQQCKHRREVDAAPASAGDGEVLGGSAIACVKDVDFHKINYVIAPIAGGCEERSCSSRRHVHRSADAVR